MKIFGQYFFAIVLSSFFAFSFWERSNTSVKLHESKFKDDLSRNLQEQAKLLSLKLTNIKSRTEAVAALEGVKEWASYPPGLGIISLDTYKTVLSLYGQSFFSESMGEIYLAKFGQNEIEELIEFDQELKANGLHTEKEAEERSAMLQQYNQLKQEISLHREGNNFSSWAASNEILLCENDEKGVIFSYPIVGQDGKLLATVSTTLKSSTIKKWPTSSAVEIFFAEIGKNRPLSTKQNNNIVISEKIDPSFPWWLIGRGQIPDWKILGFSIPPKYFNFTVIVIGVLAFLFPFSFFLILIRGKELKTVNRSLKFQIRKKNENVELLNQFNNHLAHEIKTPLSAAINMAEICISRSRNPDFYRDAIKDILRKLSEMKEIITRIHELSIQSNSSIIGPQELRMIINQVIDEIRVSNEFKDIQFKVENLIDEHSIFPADPTNLKEIATNLIKNAILHGNPQSVLVSYEFKDGTHFLHVLDSGKGIPINTLLDIFKSNNNTRPDPNPRGHGVGLRIAQTLARQMGGEISAVSSLGHGSLFSLNMPDYQIKSLN